MALLHNPIDVPLENLEAALVGYLESGSSDAPFLVSAVPREVRKQVFRYSNSFCLLTLFSACA